jgi:rhamnosyl/mannosyltransferase
MISCEIGSGTTYINIAGETGLVVPPRDSVALAVAMTQLWNQPEVAASMGEAAQRRYEAVFSSDSMAKSYAEIYRSLL